MCGRILKSSKGLKLEGGTGNEKSLWWVGWEWQGFSVWGGLQGKKCCGHAEGVLICDTSKWKTEQQWVSNPLHFVATGMCMLEIDKCTMVNRLTMMDFDPNL